MTWREYQENLNDTAPTGRPRLQLIHSARVPLIDSDDDYARSRRRIAWLALVMLAGAAVVAIAALI